MPGDYVGGFRESIKVKIHNWVAVMKTSMPQRRAAEHLEAVEGSWLIVIATVAFSELDEPQAVSDLVNWGSGVASRRPETCSWAGRAEKRSRGAPRNFLIWQLVDVSRRPDPRHAERTADAPGISGIRRMGLIMLGPCLDCFVQQHCHPSFPRSQAVHGHRPQTQMTISS